jgi:glycosyltransferase involved in cell wall biosynthesis
MSSTPFAVLMCVKDEADIIERTLTNWRIVGATHYFVCDNGSTDGTLDILKQYQQQYKDNGLYFYLKEHKSITMDNHVTLNGFARMAQDIGVYWMFPCDGDELLSTPNAQYLQDIFNRYTSDCYAVLPYFDNFPDGQVIRNKWTKFFGRFSPVVNFNISVGNHYIEGWSSMDIIDHQLRYNHFPYRSAEQMMRKFMNHANAWQGWDYGRTKYAALHKQHGDKYFLDMYQNSMTTGDWPL